MSESERGQRTAGPDVPCPKCGKTMERTPVCCECGILPLAEGTFRRKDAAIAELVAALEGLLALETRYTNVGLIEFDNARAALAKARGETEVEG